MEDLPKRGRRTYSTARTIVFLSMGSIEPLVEIGELKSDLRAV